MSGRSGFWTQTFAIAKRDLMIESRGGEVFGVVLPFAAVAVFVVPLATDALATRLDQLAFPVFWLVGLLFGMQVALRQTGTETLIQRRTLALLGIDPAARFAGRSMAAALLTTGVMVVIAPLVVLFYDPRAIPAIGPSLLAVVGFAVGLSMLSTLAGDVTVENNLGGCHSVAEISGGDDTPPVVTAPADAEVDASGTLTYTLKPNVNGTARVDRKSGVSGKSGTTGV